MAGFNSIVGHRLGHKRACPRVHWSATELSAAPGNPNQEQLFDTNIEQWRGSTPLCREGESGVWNNGGGWSA